VVKVYNRNKSDEKLITLWSFCEMDWKGNNYHQPWRNV
jgi:hypothetical protein